MPVLFLQALLLIFLVVMLIEAAGLMRTLRSWLIWLVISFTLPYVLSGSSLWSTHNALRLSVFFVFGIGLLRFHEQILSPRNLIPMLIAFLTAMAIYILWKKNFFDATALEIRPAFVIAGITGSVLLLKLRIKVALLAWLGAFSYTVYLYHGLGYEVYRLFPFDLGASFLESASWFVLVLLSGLLVPVVIHRTFEKVPYARLPILGKRA